MLVIGPGGGKEVLMGLFSGVEKITGVEINRNTTFHETTRFDPELITYLILKGLTYFPFAVNC